MCVTILDFSLGKPQISYIVINFNVSSQHHYFIHITLHTNFCMSLSVPYFYHLNSQLSLFSKKKKKKKKKISIKSLFIYFYQPLESRLQKKIYIGLNIPHFFAALPFSLFFSNFFDLFFSFLF